MITLAEFKSFANIKATTVDTQLTEIVSSAISYFQEACNRIFSSTNYTEYYTGNGRAWLYLKNYPITAVSKIEYYNGYSWVEMDKTGLVMDNNKIFFPQQILFPYGVNLKITYTAGYTTVPESLKNACLERAKYLYDHSGIEGSKNNLGMSSVSEAGMVGTSTTFKEPDHSVVIDKFRRVLI